MRLGSRRISPLTSPTLNWGHMPGGMWVMLSGEIKEFSEGRDYLEVRSKGKIP